jgi:hypothetical protein
MAGPTPAGSVQPATTGKEAEMFAEDLSSAVARERIADLRRQADAARLARAVRRARRRRHAGPDTRVLAAARQPLADGAARTSG